MPSNDEKKTKRPTVKTPGTPSAPFSQSDEAHFKLISRRVFGKDGQLAIHPDERLVFLRSDDVGVNAFISLAEALKERGGGAIIWSQDQAAFHLRRIFYDFVALKARKSKHMPLGFASISGCVISLILSGNYIVACASIDLTSFSESAFSRIKGFYELTSFTYMLESKQQLDVLARFFQEAEAVIDKCAPGIDPAIRRGTAQTIAFILQDCQMLRFDRLRKLEGVVNGELITAKKINRELPALPQHLSWPSEKFVTSPEAGKYHGIINYLTRVWGPVLETKNIHRGHLSMIDLDAANALQRYLYNNGDHRELPPHLHLPPQRNRHRSPKRNKDLTP